LREYGIKDTLSIVSFSFPQVCSPDQPSHPSCWLYSVNISSRSTPCLSSHFLLFPKPLFHQVLFSHRVLYGRLPWSPSFFPTRLTGFQPGLKINVGGK
jgi:hypothetical protein